MCQIKLPIYIIMYYIGNSNIHGKGIFLSKKIKKDTPIDIGIGFQFFLLPYVTEMFGSLINHSYRANCYLKYTGGAYYVVSKVDIDRDSEITLDYRNTPWYISKPDPKWK